MICPSCNRESCTRVWFHLCPGCMGESCADCRDNLVPGIVPGQVEEGGNISVCTEWGDPLVDAAIDDQKASLQKAVAECRDSIIAEREADEPV
jgi:hypothetical protein